MFKNHFFIFYQVIHHYLSQSLRRHLKGSERFYRFWYQIHSALINCWQTVFHLFATSIQVYPRFDISFQHAQPTQPPCTAQKPNRFLLELCISLSLAFQLSSAFLSQFSKFICRVFMNGKKGEKEGRAPRMMAEGPSRTSCSFSIPETLGKMRSRRSDWQTTFFSIQCVLCAYVAVGKKAKKTRGALRGTLNRETEWNGRRKCVTNREAIRKRARKWASVVTCLYVLACTWPSPDWWSLQKTVCSREVFGVTYTPVERQSKVQGQNCNLIFYRKVCQGNVHGIKSQLDRCRFSTAVIWPRALCKQLKENRKRKTTVGQMLYIFQFLSLFG